MILCVMDTRKASDIPCCPHQAGGRAVSTQQQPHQKRRRDCWMNLDAEQEQEGYSSAAGPDAGAAAGR